MRRFVLILGASVLTMAFSRPGPSPAPDAEPPARQAEESCDGATPTSEVGRAGLRVFVDPETGELVAEPNEEQLSRLRERAAEKLRQRPGPWELRQFGLRNGGQGVFLDGWADHELVVRRAQDGSLRAVCSQPGIHEHEPEGD